MNISGVDFTAIFRALFGMPCSYSTAGYRSHFKATVHCRKQCSQHCAHKRLPYGSWNCPKSLFFSFSKSLFSWMEAEILKKTWCAKLQHFVGFSPTKTVPNFSTHIPAGPPWSATARGKRTVQSRVRLALRLDLLSGAFLITRFLLLCDSILWIFAQSIFQCKRSVSGSCENYTTVPAISCTASS